MTKHASGKHGRTVGRREPRAGWPARASAWCYRCNGTHLWKDGCTASQGGPATRARASVTPVMMPVSTLERW